MNNVIQNSIYEVYRNKNYEVHMERRKVAYANNEMMYLVVSGSNRLQRLSTRDIVYLNNSDDLHKFVLDYAPAIKFMQHVYVSCHKSLRNELKLAIKDSDCLRLQYQLNAALATKKLAGQHLAQAQKDLARYSAEFNELQNRITVLQKQLDELDKK